MKEERTADEKSIHKAVVHSLRRKECMDMPVLLAFKRNGSNFLSAWCPLCRRWHHHGCGEGHRGAHCDPNLKNNFCKTGYILVESQEIGQLNESKELRENWQNTIYRREDYRR